MLLKSQWLFITFFVCVRFSLHSVRTIVVMNFTFKMFLTIIYCVHFSVSRCFLVKLINGVVTVLQLFMSVL